MFRVVYLRGNELQDMKFTQSLFITPLLVRLVSGMSLYKDPEHRISSIGAHGKPANPIHKAPKRKIIKKPTFPRSKSTKVKEEEHSAIDGFMGEKKQDPLDGFMGKDNSLMQNSSFLAQFIAGTNGNDILSKSEDYNGAFGEEGVSPAEEKKTEEETETASKKSSKKESKDKKPNLKPKLPKKIRKPFVSPVKVNKHGSTVKTHKINRLTRNRSTNGLANGLTTPSGLSDYAVHSQEVPSPAHPTLEKIIETIDHLREMTEQLIRERKSESSLSSLSEQETEEIPSKNPYSLLLGKKRTL